MASPCGESNAKNKFRLSEFIKDAEENRQICTDFFVGRNEVTMLTESDFKYFLKEKEAVLIMFYDPCDENCIKPKNIFLSAATINQKEGNTFATVNCRQETSLCKAQGVPLFPFFKLFAKGTLAGSIKDACAFSDVKLLKFMETARSTKEKGCRD